MPSSAFFNFLFLLIYRHRAKHIGVFVISVLVVALFSSVLLVSGSIEKEITATLEAQPDFIVQKMHAGKSVEIPDTWIYELGTIEGVSTAIPRIYGSYFFEPDGEYFTIVGIDLFDEKLSRSLAKLTERVDPKAFLETPQMIVGEGVKKLLSQYRFDDHYIFRTADYKKVKVHIHSVFPKESRIVTNDMIVMPIALAKNILGIADDQATDIAVYVPNELERDSVKTKIIMQYGGIRLIDKVVMTRAYEHLFNYKGGIFLLLYMIVLATFILIVYQRYAMISSADKKEIGILRALGWSIGSVLWLKIMESLLIAVFAFMTGFLIAYGYAFLLDAPLLSELFLGYGNLSNEVELKHTADFGLVSMLFLLFILPFITAVLIPVWRIAITDPVEAMK